jgi:hypothetical protein
MGKNRDKRNDRNIGFGRAGDYSTAGWLFGKKWYFLPV